MEYTQTLNGGSNTVTLNGKLTFADHEKFRTILASIKQDTVSSLTLDFQNVEFIDSAGLGMLLIARDESAKNNVKLVLSNPQGQIRKMFKVSKFDELFTIQ